MALPDRRRLIVNADDFGLSPAVNEAVARAHQEGILTSASLMVTAGACAGAIEVARANPRLGVGLHLVLVCGHAARPPAEIPGLADAQGEFGRQPVLAGLRYFLRPALREQLRREIAAQFERFSATGLPLDHVNGHLNLHLHPTVFGLTLDLAAVQGCQRWRLTRDRWRVNTAIARGAWVYRASHAVIFTLLSAWARPRLARRDFRHPANVFGLLQNGRVDEDFVLRLLPRLPAGDSELYSHPSLTDFRHEFEALVSRRVRAAVAAAGVELIRYRDL
jgi:hopanoid biosynthesis associated protein HpnK